MAPAFVKLVFRLRQAEKKTLTSKYRLLFPFFFHLSSFFAAFVRRWNVAVFCFTVFFLRFLRRGENWIRSLQTGTSKVVFSQQFRDAYLVMTYGFFAVCLAKRMPVFVCERQSRKQLLFWLFFAICQKFNFYVSLHSWERISFLNFVLLFLNRDTLFQALPPFQPTQTRHFRCRINHRPLTKVFAACLETGRKGAALII